MVNGLPLADAKEAIVNSAVDALTAYAHHALPVPIGGSDVLLAPQQMLRLMPIYTLALLKNVSYFIECLFSVEQFCSSADCLRCRLQYQSRCACSGYDRLEMHAYRYAHVERASSVVCASSAAQTAGGR